jgi:hypothetical protein
MLCSCSLPANRWHLSLLERFLSCLFLVARTCERPFVPFAKSRSGLLNRETVYL